VTLENKTVVITGGASGIGKATVQALAKAGARVICGDIDAAGAETTVKEVRAAGGKADAIALDVTDDASIAAFIAAVLEMTPRVDILINGAGGSKNEPFIVSKPEDWQRDTDINFLGPVKITHALLQHMIDAGGGRIVNVASDAGRVGSTGETVYAGAKGGLIAFTKSLAREVARKGINVNCVCPGPTDTPLLRSRPEKMLEALERAIPLRRFGKPEEIADAIVFFAGDNSSYITGQVLSVSGGLTMSG